MLHYFNISKHISVSVLFLIMSVSVCEIPRSFERASPPNFQLKVLLSVLNSRKFLNATFFRQIALQNLQRKNLGFSETSFMFCIFLLDF